MSWIAVAWATGSTKAREKSKTAHPLSEIKNQEIANKLFVDNSTVSGFVYLNDMDNFNWLSIQA